MNKQYSYPNFSAWLCTYDRKWYEKITEPEEIKALLIRREKELGEHLSGVDTGNFPGFRHAYDEYFRGQPYAFESLGFYEYHLAQRKFLQDYSDQRKLEGWQ